MKVLLLIDSRSIPFVDKWYFSIKKRGVDIKVLSFFKSKNIPENDIIYIGTKLPGHRFKMLFSLNKVKKKINEFSPQIIHAIQVTRQGFLASLIGRKPFVVTAIGSDVFIEPKKNKIEKWIVQNCFNRADLITSMAEHMTEFIKENFKVHEKKIITFPWGCDTSIFNIDNRRIDETKPVIICTRRMDNELYNQNVILNAAPEILKKKPDAQFVFIGGGHLQEKYMEKAKNAGIYSNVFFPGWQKTEEIAGRLKESMIFISPARSDGNNISLNEAMACGCFPICADIPANRQWYKENEGGFFFQSEDHNMLAEKIISAIDNKNLRDKAKSVNILTVSERGDWNKQSEKIIEIWRKMI